MRQRATGLRWLRYILLMAAVLTNAGCYYMQAAAGQWKVLRMSEPIDEVIAAEGTSKELAARLMLVQEARRFSVETLGLPDNKSYRNYTDIEREFVVWNVFAAPEFSLQARQWCFPVAGCVSYRGYFSRDAAYRKARRLAENGYDVAIGGVSAYSTLGNFNDPVLSSMLRWDDIQLVATLFHELAHQRLYVKDDTAFNESFATAVEEAGVERWLAGRGLADDIEVYRERRQLRERLMVLVAAARDDLTRAYARPIGDEDKRQLKADRLSRLRADIDRALKSEGRAASDWPNGELNNARLASMTLYDGWLPAFRQIIEDCDGDLSCFYSESEQLSRLEQADREARLTKLAVPCCPAPAPAANRSRAGGTGLSCASEKWPGPIARASHISGSR